MIRKIFVWSRYSLALSITTLLFFQIGFAQDPKSIQLLSPDTQGGKPLMQALKERKTIREFSNKPLPLEVISDLLWAADEIGRAHV